MISNWMEVRNQIALFGTAIITGIWSHCSCLNGQAAVTSVLSLTNVQICLFAHVPSSLARRKDGTAADQVRSGKEQLDPAHGATQTSNCCNNFRTGKSRQLQGNGMK